MFRFKLYYLGQTHSGQPQNKTYDFKAEVESAEAKVEEFVGKMADAGRPVLPLELHQVVRDWR